MHSLVNRLTPALCKSLWCVYVCVRHAYWEHLSCISCSEAVNLCQTSKAPEYLAHHELESVLIVIIIVVIVVVVNIIIVIIINIDNSKK